VFLTVAAETSFWWKLPHYVVSCVVQAVASLPTQFFSVALEVITKALFRVCFFSLPRDFVNFLYPY
jgi:hypothetical protein